MRVHSSKRYIWLELYVRLGQLYGTVNAIGADVRV